MLSFFLTSVACRTRSKSFNKRVVPNASGADIYNMACTKIGCSYVYGQSGPNTFDCSGLVMWTHAQFGISLPHKASSQASCGSQGSGAIGDCVFFKNPIKHVGICDGCGNYVHAPRDGENVKISSLSSRHDINCYRRLY